MSPAESSILDEEIAELDKEWVGSMPETPVPKRKTPGKNKRGAQGSPKTRSAKKTKVERGPKVVRIEDDLSKARFDEDTALPKAIAKQLSPVCDLRIDPLASSNASFLSAASTVK